MRSLIAALLVACGGGSPQPTTVKVVPPAPKPPAVARTVDVDGVKLEVNPFVAARYANLTELAVNVTREGKTRETTSARASFVINFAGDGKLTGCRGQHVDSYLDGGKASHETRYREQQGYAGSWKLDDLWVDVELRPDNTVCPQLRRYVDLEPRPWRLRCLSVVRAGPLTVPGVLCRVENHAESQYQEHYAHAIRKIVKGEWIALGTGNGLHVRWSEEGIGLFTEKNAIVSIRAAPSPIATDAWDK